MAPGNWKLSSSKSLNHAQLDRLFEHARKDGQRTYMMVLLAYNAAMAVSELIHLRVGDFDWERGCVSILPVKKAKIKRVRYPMPEIVLREVRSYIEAQDLKSSDYLFPGRTRKSCLVARLNCKGGHISKREVQGLFAKVVKEAGLKRKGRGIHSLKHSRLSEVAAKTKNPHTVKEAGRHQSVTMGQAYMKGEFAENAETPLAETIRVIGGRI